jgi:hypothetical protein
MKDLTAPLFLTIGLIVGATLAMIGAKMHADYESELIGKGQMMQLHEVKRMCSGRIGTPNLLLDGDFYYCKKAGK